jgi:hypothetical protein
MVIDKESLTEYYCSFDIDWFLTNEEGNIVCFASSGGKIPKLVLEFYEELDSVDKCLRSLPSISKTIFNPFLEEIYLGQSKNVIENIKRESSFWSNKGVIFYDKSVVNNPDNSEYHLVSYPENPISFYSLPIDIQRMLGKITVGYNFGQNFTVDMSKIIEL